MTNPLANLERMAYDLDAARKADAETLKTMNHEQCQLCLAEGPDMRSLFMDMLYDVNEVIPEALDVYSAGLSTHSQGFYLRICKNCRGELLGMLGAWRKAMILRRYVQKDSDGQDQWPHEDNIFPVRVNGAVVYMNAEQLAAYHVHLDGENDDQA